MRTFLTPFESDMSMDRDVAASDDVEAPSASAPLHSERKPTFDCNICLDTVSSPVVTLCGHLYWCDDDRSVSSASD